MSSSAIIEYKNVQKVYDLSNNSKMYAIKNLNLKINEGESFALLGPNGAGKTTTINLLAGVVPLSSGDITVCGKSVKTDTTETKKFLGIVQQELLVDSFFPLPVILGIQSKLAGVMPDKEWIHFLLDKLQLSAHTKKTTRELSGGMKRRMMIARALVHKPKILVLDEPTAGVDIFLRHSMWEFVQELHKFGITIILTTHYLEEAEKFCHRIAIMNHGELITLKTNQELLQVGNHPKFVLAFHPNFSVKAYEELPRQLRDACEKEKIKCELVIESGQSKLYFKKEFIQSDLQTLQSSIQAVQLILSHLNGSIEQTYTEHTKLEDVFLELTK